MVKQIFEKNMKKKEGSKMKSGDVLVEVSEGL